MVGVRVAGGGAAVLEPDPIASGPIRPTPPGRSMATCADVASQRRSRCRTTRPVAVGGGAAAAAVPPPSTRSTTATDTPSKAAQPPQAPPRGGHPVRQALRPLPGRPWDHRHQWMAPPTSNIRPLARRA